MGITDHKGVIFYVNNALMEMCFSHNITEEKAKEMGIKAFLLKPILKGLMAETVRRVLDEKD